jgi:2-polyprenyl-6-methoxyphenol hydroxylase-like FAD-dependent oxidoreductase
MGTTTIGDHAVVLGGSMAGLLAARVLAESYVRVTVVERDLLPAAAGHRRGVPQGRHVHALRARGRELLEDLFEGFTDELVARGAEIGDELAQARWLFSGQRLARTTTGRTVLSLSRPMLEGHLRARVRAIRSVTVIDGCDVLGLTSTPDRHRITGVHVLDRAAGSTARTLEADLVLDATGRASRRRYGSNSSAIGALSRNAWRSGSATPAASSASALTPSAATRRSSVAALPNNRTGAP